MGKCFASNRVAARAHRAPWKIGPGHPTPKRETTGFFREKVFGASRQKSTQLKVEGKLYCIGLFNSNILRSEKRDSEAMRSHRTAHADGDSVTR